MKKACFIITTAFILLWADGVFGKEAEIYEEEKVIKTYPYSDPDPLPIMARSSLWGKSSRFYPYFFFSKFSNVSKDQSWKLVRMENPYIEVFILPQVGGKLYGAVEKSTKNEFIYLNSVMKFREVAVRGPWTSGGIEYNFGAIGHTPAGATPTSMHSSVYQPIVLTTNSVALSLTFVIFGCVSRSRRRLLQNKFAGPRRETS